MIDDLVARLTDRSAAWQPDQLREDGLEGLQQPGLYSWWVDADGADELTRGLDTPVESGLLYAGQAGATRRGAHRPSSGTLWTRLAGMHLGRRADMSTLRRTLAAALLPELGLTSEDDARLGSWIDSHMSVIAVPVQDGASLAQQEAAVVQHLDPPFNLHGRPDTPIRKELRRRRNNRR